jgi:hypothetical protein
MTTTAAPALITGRAYAQRRLHRADCPVAATAATARPVNPASTDVYPPAKCCEARP